MKYVYAIVEKYTGSLLKVFSTRTKAEIYLDGIPEELLIIEEVELE